jgi:hypothetical protein
MYKQQDYITSDSDTQNLSGIFSVISNPVRLFKEGEVVGIKGIKKCVSLSLLFISINLILFFVGFVMFIAGEITTESVGFLAAVFITGISFTGFAAFLGYQYMVKDITRVIYQKSGSYIKRFCSVLIDKAEEFYKGYAGNEKNDLQKLISFTSLVSQYYDAAPGFIRSRIAGELNKTPFLETITRLRTDIINGDKREATETLYSEINTYMLESVFGKNNTSWVYYLIPLNLFIQLLLLFNI